MRGQPHAAVLRRLKKEQHHNSNGADGTDSTKPFWKSCIYASRRSPLDMVAIIIIVYVLFFSLLVVYLDFSGFFESLLTTYQSLIHYGIPTVAFVVTITGCDSHFGGEKFLSIDGAAVLAYSIRQNSIHGPNGGKYDYHLYAFYHPNASECALPLAELGYIVEERDTPVAMADIRNKQLRSHIQKWGCCGEKELIKFEAFTLTQYPIVVLCDADTLILKPLDRLFDFLLDTTKLPADDDLMYVGKPAASGVNTDVTIPKHLDMLFTIDYATVHPDVKVKPIQGGFNIFRPNVTIRNDIYEIVKKGDYRFDGTGWGGHTGPMFWGDTTFQGLVPYYFQILYPGRALELNYCVWNDNNYPPMKNGKCTTLQENCEDCRLRPINGTGSIHYTSCYKPWLCHIHSGSDPIHNEKCHVLLREWFKMRSAMEISWGRSGHGDYNYGEDVFLGYCSDWGIQGYQQLQQPFGKPLNDDDIQQT